SPLPDTRPYAAALSARRAACSFGKRGLRDRAPRNRCRQDPRAVSNCLGRVENNGVFSLSIVQDVIRRAVATGALQPIETETTLLDDDGVRFIVRAITCLSEVQALGHYDGGTEAGASQPRKHLQFVPLPLAPESSDEVPMERLIGSSPGLTFSHAFSRIAPQASGPVLHALYRELLYRCG